MELHSPLISILVPAYNAQDTLRDTLRSAAAGTYRNIEIIVVDDGSTDGTSAIAEELADRDPRIRIIRRENGGPSAAQNSGFAVATGEYIARLDADDLWHPSKLEGQIDFARDYPDTAFIYTFARYIDEADRVISDGPRQELPQWALCRGICESIVGGGSSALIKRSAVEEAGGCNESLRSWEDLLLQARVSARHPIGVVPQYLVGYRVRPHSLTSDIDAILAGWRAVRRILRADFPYVPSFVLAWAHAARCAMFAEGYAWRGRYVRSAGLLLEAVLSDPQWLWHFLRYRIARRAGQRPRPTGPSKPAALFFDCDPAQPITPADWFDGHPAQIRFARFEQERRLILSALDDRLARERADAC